MQHATRARAALARLPEIDPAIAALALWCRYRDSPGPTETHGETIHLGPEFPLLPLSEQTGLIAHHILHVALRHSARAAIARERHGDRFRAEQFNLACDALVNEALLQGGHALPRPAVRASELVGLLPREDRPENVLADWDCDRLYAALAARTGPTGGGTEDETRRYAQARGFSPDLKSGTPDRTEAEIWAGRVEQALRTGSSAGSGIGTVLARFADLPKATVPWEIRLRRMLARALLPHPQTSHRRPSRTWLARDALARQTGGPQPAFEPARLRDTRRPRLVIGLDTSSSVPDTALRLFAAEAISMTRKAGAETHLLGFDTEVHSKSSSIDAGTITTLALRQGGGTDFAPVLAEASALQPSMIVILTDLDAPTGPAPAAPVLWAVPAPPEVTPSFGDVLIMKDQPPANTNV